MSLTLALALIPAGALAGGNKKKSSKHFVKQVVTIEHAQAPEQEPEVVPVTNPAQQLYGEWTITDVEGRKAITQERPYIYLDFMGGNKFYGCNGCNAINGSFSLQDQSVTFADMISTSQQCHSATSERSVMRALADARTYVLTERFNIYYLDLKNASGKTVMKLRRQNLDFLNGAWVVKEMGGSNVKSKNLRLVIDIPMLTVTALTKCNIINGIVHIDPRKEQDVQFEDLKSAHQGCDGIDDETQLLINLEEVTTCKRINDHEMGLMDHSGTIVLVLDKIDLKKDHKF